MKKEERESKKIELIKKIFEMAYKNKKDDIFVEYHPHCEELNVSVDKGGWPSSRNSDNEIIYLNWDGEFGEDIILKLENIIKKLKRLEVKE